MMTEEEAKTKWCSFVRYSSPRGNSINRWMGNDDKSDSPDMSRCIGSRCMHWRWTTVNEIRGYCGLAGKP